MPVYEYACTACGERTEARQSFDDPPLEECPICGGRLRKLFSPVGIVFKGSGFYATDAKKSSSKSSGSKGETTSKSDSASKRDSKDGSSSDGSSSAGSRTGASDSPGSKDPGSKEKSA
ncbi:MAG: FmdB family transcriptional regulator [Actinobacteria bacterium]|nr:FmdB family transcriptional regulator [Actinomycetota bacterium]